MTVKSSHTLFDTLDRIPDNRHCQGKRHPLQAVLAMTIAAMLAGDKTTAAIAQWGRDMYKYNRPWMWRLGFRSYTTPSVSTLHEIFKALEAERVEGILAAWIDGLLGHSRWRAVSIDGKALRGSARKKAELPGVHLVSAYLHDPGCVLAQVRVDSKTNEHKAALELIGDLVLEKTVLVGDAMFCQKDLCQAVVDKGGDYFLAVKDNQPSLKRDIEAAFAPPVSPLGTACLAG